MTNIQKNKKLHIVAALSVVVVMLVGSLGLSSDFSIMNSVDADNSQKPIAVSLVQWDGFTGIQHMTDSSTAIVIASVDKTTGTKGVSVPVTFFDLTVKESIKGDLKPGQKISYEEFGGIYSYQYAIHHHIMVEEGNEYLFFMKENPKSGNYYAIGGPNGKFIIRDGIVDSLDALKPEVLEHITVPIESQSLSSLKNDIKEFVFQKEQDDKEAELEK